MQRVGRATGRRGRDRDATTNEQARAVGRAAADAGAGAGGQRFLRKREIEDMLAAHGVELAAKFEFRAPAQVDDLAARVGRTQMHAVLDATDESACRNSGRSDRHAWRSPRSLMPHEADIAAARMYSSSYRELLEHARLADAAGCEVTCDVAERHLATTASRQRRAQFAAAAIAPWTGRQRFVISFTTAQGAGRRFPFTRR